jgi:hypothetical protein
MRLEELIEILKMSDLFCGLSDFELQSIAKLYSIEEFKVLETL